MDYGLLSVGAALAFAAMGSALGTGTAGMATIGAWKRCFLQNRPAPFLLLVFVGAPLTQTLYGFILMGQLQGSAEGGGDPGLLLGIGLFGGIAIGMSSWFQGKAAAGASDALAETGQGFGNYLFVVGIVETVALFVMALSIAVLP
ncbi:MAG: V-type ATP synthase subunit K [Spirochaetales bacterium]